MRRIHYFAVFILAGLLCSAAVPGAEAKLSKRTAEETWKSVAQATDLTSLPFSVKDDKTPNAWVRNGNSVAVTTALLDMLDSPAELYGVFAHEAGHAKLGHYNETVNRSTGLSLAATVLGKLLGDVGGAAASLGANLANAGYSRSQEIEADDYSVKLSHEHGEDITGLYRALVILSKYNKTEPSGFNSHPPDDRRLLHIKNTILSIEANAKIPTEEEVLSQASKAQTQNTDTKPSKRRTNVN
jgi:putative metalloprotease